MSIESRYGQLKKRYEKLSKKYAELRKKPRMAGEEMMKNLHQQFAFISSAAIGLILYALYQQWIMIEVGLMCALIDVYWELRGTGNGWWSYKKSVLFDIMGRVPVDVPLTFFFLGMMAAGIVLFFAGYQFL